MRSVKVFQVYAAVAAVGFSMLSLKKILIDPRPYCS